MVILTSVAPHSPDWITFDVFQADQKVVAFSDTLDFLPCLMFQTAKDRSST